MEKIKLAIEESKRTKQSIKDESYNNKNSTSTIKHAEQKLNDPHINYEYTRVIPLNPENLLKNRIVSFSKNDRFSLSFDILRTQVIKKMKENDWRTIAITSPIPGCGKSVISINMAMSIAHHTDRTALLVDFDLRRPSIAKYLGLPPGPSINEVFSGEASVQEALVNPGLERFVVLPTMIPVRNSSEILSTKKAETLINELRERYTERIVIFDIPPILGSDDAMIMMSQVDCVLVVIGNGMVSKDELNESMKYIGSNKLLGTVLNKVESPHIQRAYYDY